MHVLYSDIGAFLQASNIRLFKFDVLNLTSNKMGEVHETGYTDPFGTSNITFLIKEVVCFSWSCHILSGF